MATALLVWSLSGDLMRGITVLIVFCPCALVLATPTAIVASLGHAARRAILVKGGEYAEGVGQVHVVAFDKTGTLTVGRPPVTEVVPAGSLDAAAVLRVAAAAERFSEHPLGQAVHDAARRQQLDLPPAAGFRAVPGRGVEARVDGQRVLVGRASWLAEQGVVMPQAARQRLANLETAGHTVLVSAVDGAATGLIAVRDVLRPEAKQAVDRLKAQGLRVLMLTGDNERVARAMATQAGIEEVHAGLLPDDKLRLVRAAQGRGERVAFVGDGINDAPALAAADIGVAMGVAGTDLALETADIAFLTEDLSKMAEAVALSRRTLRVIRQNIWFSVVMNVASVVAAGLGWLNPIAGAVVHEGSAMAVILNAIRLLR